MILKASRLQTSAERHQSASAGVTHDEPRRKIRAKGTIRSVLPGKYLDNCYQNQACYYIESYKRAAKSHAASKTKKLMRKLHLGDTSNAELIFLVHTLKRPVAVPPANFWEFFQSPALTKKPFAY